jgi:hypothetical protein
MPDDRKRLENAARRSGKSGVKSPHSRVERAALKRRTPERRFPHA